MIQATENHYLKDNVPYDRITSVLNYFKEPWYVNWVERVGKPVANRIGKKARKIGSRVDELVRKDLQDRKYRLKKSDVQEVENCMIGWEKFKTTHEKGIALWGDENVVTQHTMFDENLGVAGTSDVESVAIDTLIDVKAAKKISASYWVQVGQYNKMNLNPYGNLAILRLDPFWASFEYVSIPMNEHFSKLFQAHLDLYRYYQLKQEEAE